MDKLPTAQPLEKPPFNLPSTWLMAAILALCAALVLPKNNPFSYHFEAGKAWDYADLKAPFDFEVVRPEAEIADQLAQLAADQTPYFLLNSDIARVQKRLFQREMEAQIERSRHDVQFSNIVANKGAYLNFSLGLLDEIFSAGVLPMDTGEWRNRSAQPIFLWKNGLETRQTLGNLRTLYAAHAFLTDTLPFSKLENPEFLLPILEKCLAPNLQKSDSLSLVSRQKKRDAMLKTGISVQKGEVIVRRGEVISSDIFQKLSSLRSRSDPPNRTYQLLGYLGLCGLAAVALALLVLVWFPEKWDDRLQSLLIFTAVLANVLIFSGLARVGDGVALLTPMLFLLFFLHQFFQKDLVWMTYLLAVLVTGLALDWSFGWSVIQFAGGFSVLLFPRRILSWRGRAIVAGTAASVMTAAYVGVILAGKISRAAQSWEVAGFIWLAALGSLAAFPLANFLRKKLEAAS